MTPIKHEKLTHRNKREYGSQNFISGKFLRLKRYTPYHHFLVVSLILVLGGCRFFFLIQPQPRLLGRWHRKQSASLDPRYSTDANSVRIAV